MPFPSCLTPKRVLAVVLAGPLLVGAVVGLGCEPRRAEAQVAYRQGFQATVLGWSSWYGSYDMGPLGAGWCIDHGSHAPDPAFGYEPTSVATSDDTRAAMAWAVARYSSDDPVSAAALMLVMHDLMGAQYPFGRLDVHAMTLRDLAGFQGLEAPVLHQARLIKNDALAHRHLRGPLQLTASAALLAPLAPGQDGDLVVELHDALGQGVDAVDVAVTVAGATPLGATTVRTDAAGRATLRVRAGEGTNRFSLSTAAPDPTLHAWASTTTHAQRIVRPERVSLTAQTEFTAHTPTGTLVVDKDGDAEPYLGVGGAIFEVHHAERGPVKTLVTGADGRTPVAELDVGSYRLVETRPPAGYAVSNPVDFIVAEGQQVELRVSEKSRHSELVIEKVDGVSGEPVPGAHIEVRRDADGDGEFETLTSSLTTTDESADLTDLLPGHYRVVEVQPPAHHLGASQPVDVDLTAGTTQTVRIENVPLATASFSKVPESDPPPGAALAGAVFTVTERDNQHDTDATGHDTLDDTGLIPPALACNTDDEGRCRLPDDALLVGHEYCWEETEAPPGFGRADGSCFTPVRAGEIVEIRVDEPVVTPPSPTHPSADVESQSISRPSPNAVASSASALPVTGGQSRSLGMIGAGLVALGTTLARYGRRRASQSRTARVAV